MEDLVSPRRKDFLCSLCVDVVKDPVTIPCGHNYCKSCIEALWDKEDEKQTCSCPQCSLIFIPRPALQKNIMLATFFEELRKPGLQAAAKRCHAGPKDVACDVCMGRKLKASKSCLICLASFCEEHLQPHHESPAFENHKLVEPSKNHKENIQRRIRERQKDVKVLQQEVEAINEAANKTVMNSDVMFSCLRQTLEKRQTAVKQLVRAQQKQEVTRVREVQEQLQQEIAELKKKLEHLSQDNDDRSPTTSLAPLCKSVQLPKNRPLQYFHDTTEALDRVEQEVMYILGQKWPDVPRIVVEVDVLLPHDEPKTRAEFLKYSEWLSLDMAYPHVRPSDHKRKARVIELKPSFFSDNSFYSPDNYAKTGWSRLMTSPSLKTGHSYWEVRWRGRGVHVGVDYMHPLTFTKPYTGSCISPCEFGMDEKSWVLLCEQDKYHYWDNGRKVPIPVQPSSRVGMYLDQREGILSFYKISDSSDTMTFLHRVKTTFTRQISAAIWINNEPGTTAELSISKKINGLYEMLAWLY